MTAEPTGKPHVACDRAIYEAEVMAAATVLKLKTLTTILFPI